jgi:hypothetical protein
MTKKSKNKQSCNLINNFIYPTLSFIFGGLILGIISKTNTGQFFKYFLATPVYIWIIIGVIIIIWILLLNRRRKVKLAYSYIINKLLYSSATEYIHLFQITYKKLNWNIKGEFYRGDADFSCIESDTPPRCPRCNTEIEEYANLLFWGYRWRCPSCKFFKISINSYHKLKRSVDKIVKNKYDKKKDNNYGLGIEGHKPSPKS